MVSAIEGSGSSPLAGDIVLCFWARHFTLTVPLFNPTNKWIPSGLMPREPFSGLASHPVGVAIPIQRPGISVGLIGHLARVQTLPYIKRAQASAREMRRFKT